MKKYFTITFFVLITFITMLSAGAKILTASPNPTYGLTTITYTITTLSSVTIIIYNFIGQEKETLVSESKNSGTYTVDWDASSYPNGYYLCVMTAEGKTNVIKITKI